MKNQTNTWLKTGLTALVFITSQAQAGAERDPLLTYFLMDTLEISNDSGNPTSWDATAWVGTDWHKLYLKTEGENVNGQKETENQLLYSRPIKRFWDIQMGLGYDTTPENTQTWGVIGLQGLAPYFFETNVALVANDQNIGLRFDTEYEALITQKLILTPSIAFDVYSNNDPQMGLGSGLSSSQAELRLRYEFTRKFAPYIGVTHNHTYGKKRITPKQKRGKFQKPAGWRV
jgi:copper resistance protein B